MLNQKYRPVLNTVATVAMLVDKKKKNSEMK